MSILELGRARGWFTIEETSALTGYTPGSLYTFKSAERGFMALAYKGPDRRVRVPFDAVMEFLA